MDVTAVIQNYLRDEVGITEELSPDTQLLGGLVDSLELMKLMAFVEEEFGIVLDDEDITIEHFRTIGAVEGLVNSRLAAL